MGFKLEDDEGRPWTASTHWGWITLLCVTTFGIALLFLSLYLSLWIHGKSRSRWPLIGFLISFAGYCLFAIFLHNSSHSNIADLADNIASTSWIAATFLLRHEIQRYYKETENWQIHIGPVFTFFFSAIYINYCLNPLTLPERSPMTSLNLRK